MPTYIELPTSADLIADRAGNVQRGATATVKLRGTATDATHAKIDGSDPATGGLIVRADGTFGTATERRYFQSGVPVDVTVANRTRMIEPVSAFGEGVLVEGRVTVLEDTLDSVETEIAGTRVYVENYAAAGYIWNVNDSAPWQAAIDAAHAAGGGRVLAKSGRTYAVQPLKTYSDVVIDLNGATLTAITRVGGTNIWDALIYTAGCTAANGCTGDGTTVTDDGGVENGTISTLGRCYSAIKTQNVSRFKVRNVRFPTNQDKIGVRLDYDSHNCEVSSCRIVSTLDSPFGTVTNAQGVSIYADTGDALGTGGAYGAYGTATVNLTTFNTPAHPSRRHVITNNRIEGGTHGVSLSGATECVVANNVFTDTSHRSVIASVSARNQISDNVAVGQFSCAYLLCFGSCFNTVSGNVAYCTTSVSELNAFRASFGSSDNLFSGNYAYGVTGAAFRAFTGSNNNTFTGNKAEACGVGLEFRSMVTDDGYAQNINTPAMNGNAAISNDFIGCGVGIQIRAGTTVLTGTTPATAGGVAISLSCVLIGNRVQSATTNGVLFIEDTAGVFASNTGINNCTGLANSVVGSGSVDWQTPRGNGHWVQFQANAGGGLQGVLRLPASGNGLEWRDSTDALKGFIGATGGLNTSGRFTAGASTLSTVAISYMSAAGNTQIALRVDSGSAPSVDIQQWTKNAGPTATVAPLTRVDKNGTVITGVHAAPADADLVNGEMAIWFDQTAGAAKLMVKAKNSSGTVVTGNLALT